MEAKMKVGFAQIGTAHAHASGKVGALRASPDVAFRGVYEPDPALRPQRERDATYRDVHWFDTEAQVLQEEEVAAVAVESHVADNLAIARRALEHGKHVWLDKPAGNDWQAFQDLIELARSKGLRVQLGYMFRYNPGFQLILDWVQEGRLGQVFSVRGRMSQSLSEARRTYLAAYEGGILFELLCHLIDIVVAMLGRPDRVTSFLRDDLRAAPPFEDNTLTVFEYPRAMAMLSSAAMEVSPFAARRFEAYGTRGSLILEPFETDPVLRIGLDAARHGFESGWQQIALESPPRYVASLAALVADIRGERAPDRSLDHELLVQETVLRASGILT
jgi:predicted dehydrogenase